MGWVLLWTESLTACLMLVMLATACSVRLSKRWLRVGVPVLTALVPGLIALWGGMLAAALIAYQNAHAYDWVVWWAGGWVCAFLVGTVLAVRAGLRRRAGLAWSRGGLLIATVAAGVLGVTTVWTMDLAARARLAAAHADGVGLAAYVSSSRPPDSQNAALIYERAFHLIGEDTEVPGFDPEGDNATARAFVERQAAALALLRQAAQMPECYFPYGLTAEGLGAVPLKSMRQAAKLLLLDARVQAADGKAGVALLGVETAFRMVRQMDERPVLIHAMVAVAIGALADTALQDILTECRPSLDDLKQAPVDQTFSFWRLLRHSMEIETAFGLANAADMAQQTGGSIFMVSEVEGYRGMMAEYVTVLAKPYYEAREGIERLDESARRGKRGMLQAMLPPVFGRATPEAALAQARYELDNMALAATAYRIEHGAYPKTAGDLVPDYLTLVPLDPFTGRPMKVKAEDGGAVLYSVGPDMTDDGGAPFDQTSRNGDITFRLGERSARTATDD